MTREEKFEKAVYDYFKKIEERMNGFDYFNHEHIEHAFIDGVEWADKNPKSSWISVNDDLPCNHKELLENEHYTKTVLVVLSWNEHPSKRHISIYSMSNKIGSFDVDWYWYNTADYTVTHWMSVPQLPNE